MGPAPLLKNEMTQIKTLYEHFKSHPQISTDSRQIAAGSLFFALKGASFDGNRFAADALEKGAAYAIIDNPEIAEKHPEWRDRFVVVDDTLKALQALAREHRRALGIPILAIAGSNGKTTTKELTAAVLERDRKIYATRGNLNNHIGVPLTLLAMTPEIEFGIVEMGASACGEIALLCSIAEPDYGLLTNIGRAHLDGFGGPEGIRRGKGELFDFLALHNGRAFVPQEDPTLSEMAQEREGLQVETYSTRLAEGVEHQLEGDFNRLNIAAAMAVGRFFEVSEESIRSAIAAYTPSNHRSQRMERARNTLILDCYNANPSSMAASLGHFGQEPLGEKSRKAIILGDMLELGSWSHEEHIRILKQALSIPEVEIFLVGPHFTEAHAALGAPAQSTCYPSRHQLVEALQHHPIDQALILIKGSHSIGLEHLTEIL